jgi:hypothetical protein
MEARSEIMDPDRMESLNRMDDRLGKLLVRSVRLPLPILPALAVDMGDRERSGSGGGGRGATASCCLVRCRPLE